MCLHIIVCVIDTVDPRLLFYLKSILDNSDNRNTYDCRV